MIVRNSLRYVFALFCVAAALVVSELLGAWVLPDVSTFYILSILVASSVSGLAPGLLATVLSAAAIAYAQAGWTLNVNLGWDDVLRIGVFTVVALIVSSLAARQRAAEAQLRTAIARLKEADETKDRFLAVLSHELRTPLTSILGWAGILASTNDAETVAAAAESIQQSARSQKVLVDDLLDLSRIVFSKFRIEASPLDLVPVVQATATLIKPVAEAKQVKLTTSVPMRPCVISGDEQRIKQVIWNFLSNAVKFTPPGGVVNLNVDVEASQVRLVVSDTGEGIEPQVLPHVFERFRQGDPGTNGGLGLGLAIARYLVEAHKGSVLALSDGRGKGATFIASFPLSA